MDTFIKVMGWITVVVVFAGLSAIVCVLLVGLFEALLTRLEERGEQRARLFLYEKLRSGSYWFSEDPATSELFRIYADKVIRGNEYDIHGIREDWRSHKKKIASEQAAA